MTTTEAVSATTKRKRIFKHFQITILIIIKINTFVSMVICGKKGQGIEVIKLTDLRLI